MKMTQKSIKLTSVLATAALMLLAAAIWSSFTADDARQTEQIEQQRLDDARREEQLQTQVRQDQQHQSQQYDDHRVQQKRLDNQQRDRRHGR